MVLKLYENVWFIEESAKKSSFFASHCTTYLTGLIYLKSMLGNVNKADINLSCKISPTSGVIKITKILVPGCKFAVDSKIQAW